MQYFVVWLLKWAYALYVQTTTRLISTLDRNQESGAIDRNGLCYVLTSCWFVNQADYHRRGTTGDSAWYVAFPDCALNLSVISYAENLF